MKFVASFCCFQKDSILCSIWIDASRKMKKEKEKQEMSTKQMVDVSFILQEWKISYKSSWLSDHFKVSFHVRGRSRELLLPTGSLVAVIWITGWNCLLKFLVCWEFMNWSEALFDIHLIIKNGAYKLIKWYWIF